MKKQLELKQDGAGQWMYRVMRDGEVSVPWEYGPFDRAECIEQAKSRFGSDLEVK